MTVEIEAVTNAALSVGMFAQQRCERLLSCAVSFTYRFEENFREFNRALSAHTINLPSPRFRRQRPALYDN
jgi:hypothetical protein